jgi:3-hydroxyisobutyrate dehydrogenase-like beta-hydroxyacid dehydrogenase
MSPPLYDVTRASAGELDTLISALPHCRLISSPVFGAPAAAAAGQLLIYMAGDHVSKKAVAHLLVPAVGRKVTDLGGNLEKAPTFKLIGNAMILGSMEILAEAYTVATKAGVDQAVVYEYVKGACARSHLPASGSRRRAGRRLVPFARVRHHLSPTHPPLILT